MTTASHWRQVGVSLLILAVVLSLKWIAPSAASFGPYAQRLSERLFWRGLNIEDRERGQNGYYEVLLNRGQQLSSRVTSNDFLRAAWQQQTDKTPPPIIEPVRSFRSHVFAPNTVQEFTDLHTNSLGYPDREFALEKPPGTRRIAVLGDSTTRGFGARYGQGWEPQLEDRLNAQNRSDQVSRFELMNFAVDGYRITQVLDTALEDVRPFKPDVYLVVFSEKMISRSLWSSHLSQLIRGRRDLKYPFLRDTVAEAGVAAGDRVSRSRAMLEGARVKTIDWALREIQDAARHDGATVVVAMIPTITRWGSYDEAFGPLYPVFDSLGIPLVDALDAFDGQADLEALRFKNEYFQVDPHPNEAGYAILFERLYAKILANPTTRSAILGQG